MKKNLNISWMKSIQKPIIIFFVGLLLTILQPNIFLTPGNIRSIFFAISIFGIMVCGSIYPILLGGIDLAVGANAAMSGAITVLVITNNNYSQSSVLLAVILGLAAGVFTGILYGSIIAKFTVPPFLITLSCQYLIYGVTQLLTQNKVISCLEPKVFTYIGGGRILGIPIPIYILILTGVLSYLLLNKTTFGRLVYVVGGNRTAAELSGVSCNKIIISSYAISGFTAALAGIVLASMNQQAIAKAALGYELDVISAIVVGGASLMGGEGSLISAMFGALLLGMINNGLRLMGIPSIFHGVFKGLIIVLAVAYDSNYRYRNSGLMKKTKFFQKYSGKV